MTNSLTYQNFTLDGYYNALRNGNLKNVSVGLPFFKIDKNAYNYFLSNGSNVNYSEIRKRLDEKTYCQFRSSITFCRCHEVYFPAYRFLINECINDEWLSMVDWHKAFHRDHLIHQPLTAYVVQELLTGNVFKEILGMGDTDETLLDRIAKITAEDGDTLYLREYYQAMCGNTDLFLRNQCSRMRLKWLIMDTFLLAALFHDLGYPFRFLGTLREKLDLQRKHQNYWYLGVNEIGKVFNQRLVLFPLRGYQKPDITTPDSWGQRVCKLIEQSMAKTHGLPGALSFLYMTDILRSFHDLSDYPARRFRIEWAAMAILMHDMAGIYAEIDKDNHITQKHDYLRLSLNRDPLSFVLTLADLIQDFARPSASFSNTSKHSVSVAFPKRCAGVTLEWDSGTRTLGIYYKYRNSSDYARNRNEFVPRNQILFFDPQVGYLDYQDASILNVKLCSEKI